MSSTVKNIIPAEDSTLENIQPYFQQSSSTMKNPFSEPKYNIKYPKESNQSEFLNLESPNNYKNQNTYLFFIW